MSCSCGSCPCCDLHLHINQYEMTIWLKEDTKKEKGMGRFFATSNDAIRRFAALQKDLYSCIIEKVTETGEEVCIFDWGRDCGYRYSKEIADL